jgi:hypothetical protein
MQVPEVAGETAFGNAGVTLWRLLLLVGGILDRRIANFGQAFFIAPLMV